MEPSALQFAETHDNIEAIYKKKNAIGGISDIIHWTRVALSGHGKTCHLSAGYLGEHLHP